MRRAGWEGRPPRCRHQSRAVKPLARAAARGLPLTAAKDREAAVDKAPPAPITERPGVDRPRPRPSGSRGTGTGTPRRTTSSGSPAPGGSRPRAGSGSMATGSATTRAGIACRFWSDRQTDRLDYRKDGPRRPSARRARPSRPATDTSTSPGNTFPTATAWSGSTASGPRPRQAGRGSPRSGSGNPRAGSSRKATGTGRLDDRGTLFAPAQVDPSARTRRYRPISPTRRSPRRATAGSTGPSAGRTPTTTAIPVLLRRQRQLLRLCQVRQSSGSLFRLSRLSRPAAVRLSLLRRSRSIRRGLRVGYVGGYGGYRRRLWRLWGLWRVVGG